MMNAMSKITINHNKLTTAEVSFEFILAQGRDNAFYIRYGHN